MQIVEATKRNDSVIQNLRQRSPPIASDKTFRLNGVRNMSEHLKGAAEARR
jgi:hypothetical protein